MILPAAVVFPSFPSPGRRIGYVVCVQPVAWPEPDPLIAAAIAAKYRGKRPRPLAVQIRDRLGQWVAREDLPAPVGVPGQPGWAPAPLALGARLQRAGERSRPPGAGGVAGRGGGGGAPPLWHAGDVLAAPGLEGEAG